MELLSDYLLLYAFLSCVRFAQSQAYRWTSPVRWVDQGAVPQLPGTTSIQSVEQVPSRTPVACAPAMHLVLLVFELRSADACPRVDRESNRSSFGASRLRAQPLRASSRVRSFPCTLRQPDTLVLQKR